MIKFFCKKEKSEYEFKLNNQVSVVLLVCSETSTSSFLHLLENQIKVRGVAINSSYAEKVRDYFIKNQNQLVTDELFIAQIKEWDKKFASDVENALLSKDKPYRAG